ncbi:MAG: signal peptidase I [Pyrinomonadaceae bacterium]
MRTFIVCTIFGFCFLAIGCGLEKYISVRHNVASGDAMSPTINKDDHFASVGIRDNKADPIERFDIVVFKPPKNEKTETDENTRYVFRVIGLENEKVEMKQGLVFINNEILDESSFIKTVSDKYFAPVIVPKGSYFLLGDNRPNSADSRYIGTIKREDIDGKISNIIRKEDYDNGKRW